MTPMDRVLLDLKQACSEPRVDDCRARGLRGARVASKRRRCGCLFCERDRFEMRATVAITALVLMLAGLAWLAWRVA